MSAKPAGIAFVATQDGALRLSVTHSNRAEDAIWNAVEEAIDAGMTPARFKSEVAQAWEETLRQRAKEAVRELDR